MRMSRTASAAFVLPSATHTLFHINSRCKQAHKFIDDHSLIKGKLYHYNLIKYI